MSEISGTYNDEGAECPYCGRTDDVESSSYDEDSREYECESCSKKYYLHQSITVSHVGEPDCELNGETHKWAPFILRDNRAHDFCSVCGQCRPLGETEGSQP